MGQPARAAIGLLDHFQRGGNGAGLQLTPSAASRVASWRFRSASTLAGLAVKDWADSLNGGRIIMPSCAEEVAADLKVALDAVLEQDLPRVELELPIGFRFGAEEGVADQLLPLDGPPTPERVAQADRELACSLLLAFNEPKDLCLAFRNKKLMTSAKKAWKDWGKSKIMALPRVGKKAANQFGAVDKSKEQHAQAVCDFLVEKKIRNFAVVAPKIEQLQFLSMVDELLDPSKTRMVLLNPRVRGPAKKRKGAIAEQFADAFNPAFHLRFAGKNSSGIVYRALRGKGVPAPWVLATRQLPSLKATEVYRSNFEPDEEAINNAFRT